MKIYAASHLLPVSSPPIEGGAVAVRDGRFVAVGKLSELTAAYSAPVSEFPGSAIIPGLVNAHSHLELTHFPSWKIRKGIDYSPRTYTDWVIQVIKISRGLTLQEREQSVLEGIRISMESGTTAVGEIVSNPGLLNFYQLSPLAGRLYFEAIGQEPLQCADLLAQLERSVSGFRGGRLLAGLSPHAPHTLSPGFFGDVATLAGRLSVPMSVHLAESRAELEFLFDSSGPIADKLYPFAGWDAYLPPPRRTTPAAYLDALGILKPGTIAAHCVQITPSEAEILKQRGVAVVLCPRSNDKLDVGTAPVRLLKKSGIPLALGTDSLASNDSLSLLDEARYLLDRFPDDITPDEALRMVTLSGAEAIGMGAAVGSLEPDKRGDFLVVSLPGTSGPRELTEAILRDGKLLEVFAGGDRLGVGGV
jgi:cytosine/adenosine deaminase-related metal-dependent hydrolase